MILIAILILFLSAVRADATEYWASPTGSGATCGTTGASDPGSGYTTLAKGLTCLASNDTLHLTAGTYSASISVTSVPNGTSGNYTKVVGAGVASTKIQSSSGQNTINISASNVSFQEYSDMELDGNSTAAYGIRSATESTTNNMRFLRLNVHHYLTQNIFMGSDSHDWLFQDIETHHSGAGPASGVCAGGSGDGYCHGFYANGDNLTIERAVSHDNNGLGMQIYSESHIQDNVVIKNSLVYENYSWGIITLDGTNYKIYNNTVYGNSTRNGGDEGIKLQGGNTQIVRNNISYNNDGAGIACGTATCDHNLITNPDFVNAGTHDFHLQEGSDAIGCGTDVSGTLSVDYDGVSRPQGASWDCGAFEFVEAGAPERNRAIVIGQAG